MSPIHSTSPEMVMLLFKETLIKAFPCAKIAARSAFQCDFLRILPEGLRKHWFIQCFLNSSIVKRSSFQKNEQPPQKPPQFPQRNFHTLTMLPSMKENSISPSLFTVTLSTITPQYRYRVPLTVWRLYQKRWIVTHRGLSIQNSNFMVVFSFSGVILINEGSYV